MCVYMVSEANDIAFSFFALIATFILPTPTSQLAHTRLLALPHTTALTSYTPPPTTT